MIDVGGESTRPGAEPVDPARGAAPGPAGGRGARPARPRVSIDTRNASRRPRPPSAPGATLINDVSASLAEVAADAAPAGSPCTCTATPGTCRATPLRGRGDRGDAISWSRRAEAAVAAGVDEVWIDPGFGFGKTMDHNLPLLAHLERLVATGFPVVVGLSRKALPRAAAGRQRRRADAEPAEVAPPGGPVASPASATTSGRRPTRRRRPPVAVDDRIEGSVAVATWAALRGAAWSGPTTCGPRSTPSPLGGRPD